MAEIKYDEINEKAYEDAEKHKPGSDTTVVELPNSYDRDIVEAVNVLCDSLCAEDVDPGKTAEEALAFLGELISPKSVLVEKSIVENGVYDPKDDEADGYSSVNVVVPPVVPTLISKSITENNTYNAADDEADGYSSVSVNVPPVVPTLISKPITQNGDYSAAADGADGYSSVSVNVSSGGLPSNVVIGDFTTVSGNGSVTSVEVPYNGNGYILNLFIWRDSKPTYPSPAYTIYNMLSSRYNLATANSPAYRARSALASDTYDVAVVSGSCHYNDVNTTEQFASGNTSSIKVYTSDSPVGTSTNKNDAWKALAIQSKNSFKVANKGSNNTETGFAPSAKYNYIAVYSS